VPYEELVAYNLTVPTQDKFRYVEAAAQGDRPRGTLVLLHAFPLNGRMWEPQHALAAHDWRIIMPHYRGFDGGVTDPPASTVDEYAGDVIDLLDALHIEDAVIGGLSLGGYVALAILRRAPRYVRGLILADTRSQADTPEGVEGRKRMLQLLADKGPSAVVDEMVPKLLGASTRASQPALADRVRTLALSNPPQAIAGAIRALMTRPDSTPLLPTIHCPTLIVVGEEDVLTPPALSEEMHRAIPGSEIVVVPHAGHLSSLEQPDAFNSALAAFLTHRL
jgi:pimeloyl-ACP methyl ester carboxylesterase